MAVILNEATADYTIIKYKNKYEKIDNEKTKKIKNKNNKKKQKTKKQKTNKKYKIIVITIIHTKS